MNRRQLGLLAKINCIVGNKRVAIQAIGRFKKIIPLPTKEELEDNPITILWSGSAQELLTMETFEGIKITTLIWQAYNAWSEAQGKMNAAMDAAIEAAKHTLTLYANTFEGKEVNEKSSIPRSEGIVEINSCLQLVDRATRDSFRARLKDYLFDVTAANDAAVKVLTLYVETIVNERENEKSFVPFETMKKEIKFYLPQVRDLSSRKDFEKKLENFLS